MEVLIKHYEVLDVDINIEYNTDYDHFVIHLEDDNNLLSFPFRVKDVKNSGTYEFMGANIKKHVDCTFNIIPDTIKVFVKSKYSEGSNKLNIQYCARYDNNDEIMSGEFNLSVGGILLK